MPDQFGGSYGEGMGAGSTGQSRSGSSEGTSRVAEKARGLKETVTERAAEKAHSAFDSQKNRAVESVSGIASALRDSADAVGSQNESVGMLIRRAADMIDNVTQNLESKDLDQLVWDVQSLARRNPALFFGGALAIGFAAARFLKASNERYMMNYHEDYSYERGLYDSPARGGFDSRYGMEASELGAQSYGGSTYSSGNPVSRPGTASSKTLSDREDGSSTGLVSYGEDV